MEPQGQAHEGIVPRAAARGELLRRYAGHGLTSLFCWLRYWHSNIPGIEAHIPLEGTILDLGCGHGVLSNYLAIRSPRRRVIGFDLSPQRIAVARAAALPNAEFHCQDIFRSQPLPCRAIVVADVLHHLHSIAEGDELVARCVERLPLHGTLIVKEIGKRPLWKYLCTRPVDTLFYRGRVHFRSPAQFEGLFGRLGLDATFVPLHAWRPLSHVMYVCRKHGS
ncbi:MAG TPA: class I SAM-dependent methyltransferase [Planctomycetota bacterium]|nr:class I SAM-dependent methyltransferase [Planctomycetota bacterium]